MPLEKGDKVEICKDFNSYSYGKIKYFDFDNNPDFPIVVETPDGNLYNYKKDEIKEVKKN